MRASFGLALLAVTAVGVGVYAAAGVASGPLCVVQFYAYLDNISCSGVRNGAYDAFLTNTCTTYPNGGSPTSEMYVADPTGKHLTYYSYEQGQCQGSAQRSSIALGSCQAIMDLSEIYNMTCPTPPFSNPQVVIRTMYDSQPCSGPAIGGSTDWILNQFCFFDGIENYFTYESNGNDILQTNYGDAVGCSAPQFNVTQWQPLNTCTADPESDAVVIFTVGSMTDVVHKPSIRHRISAAHRTVRP